MKLQAADTSTISKAFLVLISLGLLSLLAFSLLSSPRLENRPTKHAFKTISTDFGQTIEFRKGELQFSKDGKPSESKWESVNIPNRFLRKSHLDPKGEPQTAWVRLRFNRSDVGPGALALATDFSRGRYEIFFNGVDVYRNYTSPTDVIYFWNRPFYAQLPTGLLREENEILLRIDPTATNQQGVGILRVGPDAAMSWLYELRLAVGATLPETINNILLALSLGLGILWLCRRNDLNIGLMSLVGFSWYFRNLHYYIEEPPFLKLVFSEISNGSLHILFFAIFSYAAHFMKVANLARYLKALFVVTIISLLAHWILLTIFDRTKFGLLLNCLASILFLAPLLLQAWQRPSLEHLALVSAISITIACSIHDYSLLAFSWLGATFFLQPYSSVVMYGVFGLTLGYRVLTALDASENLNVVLDQSVKKATEALRESERAKRELEVQVALDVERERIMSEIHDRIGSNLGTTLAAISRQAPDSIAVPAIKRAIADLKISVDSLEPFEGDIVALLANFRHRVETDVNAAGLEFIWSVQDCPKILWLDAVCALHILRILQEAVANIIAHSGASTIEVSSFEQKRNGVNGVLVTIHDNGIGLNNAPNSPGRGLKNMSKRALAIKSQLMVESVCAGGTAVNLWIPLDCDEVS